MRLSIVALSVFALAACSGREPAAQDDAAPTPVPAATTPAPAPSPPTRTPAQALVVPAPFHGIWDAENAPCDPPTDMRTEIAERGVTFYESHGAVTGLAIASPTRITVELAMRGENEAWTQTRSFTLSDGGARLTPSGGGDTGPPMPLKRCA